MVLDQLHKNSADYLPGGEFHVLFRSWDPTESQKDRIEQLRAAPTTSDSMERVFGQLDHVVATTPNLTLSTASGMTCYRYAHNPNPDPNSNPNNNLTHPQIQPLRRLAQLTGRRGLRPRYLLRASAPLRHPGGASLLLERRGGGAG